MVNKMGFCIICGKTVRTGANVCSSSCALHAVPKVETNNKEDGEEEGPKVVVKTKTAPSLISSLQNILSLEVVKEEIKMILVKHKWMKNRTLVSNNTVFSFGNDGIARVRAQGYTMNDIETFMKRHPGQVTIVQVENPVVAVENPVVAVENPVVAVENPVVAVENPVVAVENPVVIEKVNDPVPQEMKPVEEVEEKKEVVVPRKKRQPMVKPRVEEEN